MTCPAQLVLSDDFGDNECTFRCQLDAGHAGEHKEISAGRHGSVTVSWLGDYRVPESIAADGEDDEAPAH